MTRILIKNATLASLAGILPDQAVMIEDEFIKEIAPRERFRGQGFTEIIDAGGRLVLPGFINAHTHFYSTFACGLPHTKPAANFQETLTNLWWRLDRNLTLEDSYYSALIASIRAIRSGTTTIIDHHASPNAVTGSLSRIAAAVRSVGPRTALCYEVSDRDGPETATAGLEENRDFCRRLHFESGGSLRSMFGLHASFTVGDETLAKAVELAQELDIGFHIHAAEDILDQQLTQEKYGCRVIERLHRAGALGPRSLCAHIVHVDENEIKLLRETDTMTVHNPQSNMNNGVGAANLVALHAQGLATGLGTDTMTANMLEELRAALWLQRQISGNPAAGFDEAVNALLVNNAAIARRIWGKPIGTIEPGAYADLIVSDYRPATELTAENFADHLVFGISQAAVDTTIVGGRIVMQEKKLAGIDEDAIYQEAQKVSQKLWERF